MCEPNLCHSTPGEEPLQLCQTEGKLPTPLILNVCNDKGWWGVLEILLLQWGGSIKARKVYFCWERSIVEGGVYHCCLLEGLLMLDCGRSIVVGRGSIIVVVNLLLFEGGLVEQSIVAGGIY